MIDIQLEIKKSGVPIIWIDTSIILYMTLWKTGARISSVQKKRMAHLFDRIYNLTRQKKLICPHADQSEEIWIDRKTCLNLMNFLSLGIRSKYSESMKDHQTRQFMEAFVKGRDKVTISYQDFFHSDPIEQLHDLSDLITTVDLGLFESGLEIKKRNQKQVKKLEKLRQQKVSAGISYKNQLEQEYYAELEVINIMLKKLHNGQLPPLNSWALKDVINHYLRWWDELGGNLSDLRKFFTSSYYKAIPFNNISSKISAKLVTGKEPIKSGHTMDIYHASSAIPYVDLFITDRYMKHTITNLAIDKEYHTVVCHVGDSDQIDSFFREL